MHLCLRSIQVDSYEPNTRWRIRRAVEKSRRGRWISLLPDLFAAVRATLPPREDRSPDRPVFPGLTQEHLRTAIARACKASGTPTWSPHDLRHRRISLWHRQGETWGANRRARWAALALGDGRHVHARPSR